jgi:hypothetical protein
VAPAFLCRVCAQEQAIKQSEQLPKPQLACGVPGCANIQELGDDCIPGFGQWKFYRLRNVNASGHKCFELRHQINLVPERQPTQVLHNERVIQSRSTNNIYLHGFSWLREGNPPAFGISPLAAVPP